jgi:hypothetical protein
MSKRRGGMGQREGEREPRGRRKIRDDPNNIVYWI